MPTKSYDQYCGIAAALDVVGDRWTLLVLRELSFGQQRFTDLRAALPGIATNLLAERLRTLEEAGLVEQRELPAPAARTVYALSEDGKRVRPVLRSLAQFGLPFLAEPRESLVRPRMAVVGSLGALLDPAAAAGVDLRMRFLLTGSGAASATEEPAREELWLELRAGRLVRPARDQPADLTFTGSAAALVQLCRGADLDDLAPRLVVEGDAEALRTFARCFPAPARLAGA